MWNRWRQRLIIAVAILSSTLMITYNTRELTQTEAIQTKPQETMSDLVLTTYTLEGVIKHKVHAKRWAYQPDQGLSEIDAPMVTTFKPNGERWQVTAANGFAKHKALESKIDELDLQGHVVIHRQEGQDIVPITMTTDAIKYFPKEELVESEHFVSMNKPGLTVTGTGLKGKLKDNQIELLYNVKTHFANQSP